MMSETKKPSLKERLDERLDREFHNPLPQAICNGVSYLKAIVCKPFDNTRKKEKDND